MDNQHRISPLFDLKGKVAIVTGSSKGIGEAIARGLAEFGAKVVVSSRNQDAVDEVAARFRADGLEATGIACHVGKREQLEHLVQQTIATYGGVDILVNNAATNPVFGPITTASDEVFDKIMGVNVKSPFILSNLVHESMAQRGGGSIVHISSVEGQKPGFGLGLYSVSKAALIMLAKNQAKEWGSDGIRVNTLCPGLVKTKFSQALWMNETVLKHVEGQIPAARIAQPDEMAGLAVFLASPAASYCTGGVYDADGGYLIGG
jgi:NAD(P)-dependent dehydrogenase (short-subunit alcohol dehydrogenase family)